MLSDHKSEGSNLKMETCVEDLLLTENKLGSIRHVSQIEMAPEELKMPVDDHIEMISNKEELHSMDDIEVPSKELLDRKEEED